MKLYLFEYNYVDGMHYLICADSVSEAIGHFTVLLAAEGQEITRRDDTDQHPILYTQYSVWINNIHAKEAAVIITEYALDRGVIGSFV